MAQLYVDLGTQAMLRGELTQAVSDLKKALTLDSENTIGLNHLGLTYLGLGQKELAKEQLEHAVAVDPKFSDAYINLAAMAEEEKNFAQARRFYKKALENFEYKMRHRALTGMAHLAMRENSIDEARRLLYQSLQLNPDFCMSHFLLGTIFARESNTVRAAEEFKKSVVSTCAGNVEGHYQLGLAYMKAKQFTKARASFALLVDQYPGSLQAQHAAEQLRNLP